jgi:hypothetical protein
VFALAIVVRLIYLWWTGGLGDRLLDSMADQGLYLDLARNMAAGQGMVTSNDVWVATAGRPTSIMPPLYPFALSLAFRVSEQQGMLVARLVQAALSAVVANLALAIGARAFGTRTGRLAGTATALYPALVMYSRPLMSESLFLPLLAGLVLVSLGLLRPDAGTPRFALWGCLAGLGILARTELLLLVLPMAVIIGTLRCRAGAARAARGWTTAGVLLVLVLAPFAWHNHRAHGTPSPLPTKRWVFWDQTWWREMRTHPEWRGVALPERRLVAGWGGLAERERDRALWNIAWRFVLDHPRVVLTQRVAQLLWAYPLIPRELARDFGAADGRAFGPTSLDDAVRYVTAAERVRVWAFRAIFLMAVPGAWWALRARRDPALVLLAVLGWNVTHTMLAVGSERLRVQIDVLLIVLASVLVVHAWGRGRSRREGLRGSP